MWLALDGGGYDRKTCPECEQMCGDTKPQCPNCGRNFAYVSAPMPGRGYLLPVLLGAALGVPLLGRWLSLPTSAVAALLTLPSIALLVALGIWCVRNMPDWSSATTSRRLFLITLALILALAAAAELFMIGLLIYLG